VNLLNEKDLSDVVFVNVHQFGTFVGVVATLLVSESFVGFFIDEHKVVVALDVSQVDFGLDDCLSESQLAVKID
jgi:hypothetical protein